MVFIIVKTISRTTQMNYMTPIILIFLGIRTNYLFLKFASSKKSIPFNRFELLGASWFFFMSQIGILAITHLRFHLPLTIIYLIFLFLLLVFFLFLEVHNILNFKRNNSRIALYFRPIHQSTIYYLPAFLVISFIVLVTQTDNTSRPQGF